MGLGMLWAFAVKTASVEGQKNALNGQGILVEASSTLELQAFLDWQGKGTFSEVGMYLDLYPIKDTVDLTVIIKFLSDM